MKLVYANLRFARNWRPPSTSSAFEPTISLSEPLPFHEIDRVQRQRIKRELELGEKRRGNRVASTVCTASDRNGCPGNPCHLPTAILIVFIAAEGAPGVFHFRLLC